VDQHVAARRRAQLEAWNRAVATFRAEQLAVRDPAVSFNEYSAALDAHLAACRMLWRCWIWAAGPATVALGR
jgi:hypothetical protein